MKENMTFREMLGQRLFISVAGTEITDEMRRLIKEYRCGNIVLFQPNIVNIEQTRRLCADIQALVTEELGVPALIAIDQEGGGVTRLSEDFVNVPGAMALAAVGDAEEAYRASVLTAGELRCRCPLPRCTARDSFPPPVRRRVFLTSPPAGRPVPRC